MLLRSLLHALLASQIVAMAIRTTNDATAGVIRALHADEATAYDEVAAWKRDEADTDADEATAYSQTSVWKRGEAEADADEATAYDQTSVWKRS
ncbi:hypothetical protein ACMFMG_001157 [Clarireedia jacksonii]